MRPHMARPQIRPPIFVPLQNGMAAALSASLLAADGLRRLLYAYPDSAPLWWLSVHVNRTLMPVMHYLETYLATPERVTACLVAGIVIPMLAWWTRYWFATALAGHLTLAGLLIITQAVFRRGTLGVPSSDIPTILAAMQPSLTGFVFLGLSLFVLVMCLADHAAFFRMFVGLFRRRGKNAPPAPSTGDLRGL
jgi:hypothetical protein